MTDAALTDLDLDDQFLDIVQAERARSVGFDLDAQLSASRARALNYYKGEMADIPALDNRSRAVSSDIADAVETILPDLIEIFTSQDDVLAFLPTGPEDCGSSSPSPSGAGLRPDGSGWTRRVPKAVIDVRHAWQPGVAVLASGAAGS